MALISVVIPAYRPKGFDCILASIAANPQPNIEWIVVDDGSGAEFDEVFQTLPSCVRVIRRPTNNRQAAARNVGLAAATGSWVKFLDADDQLDADHLLSLYSAIKTDAPCMLPFAPTLHVYPSGKTVLNESWRNLPLEPSAQFRRMLAGPFLHHCGVLFPRALLVKLGGYDESLVTDEDGDLLLRVLQAGYCFMPVESVNYWYVHNLGGGRVSSDDDISKFNARVKVCKKIRMNHPNGLAAAEAEALAQRMDQIALSFWQAYPLQAKNLLIEARKVAPGYRIKGRFPINVIRQVLGVGATIALVAAYRRLRGRPVGGAQG